MEGINRNHPLYEGLSRAIIHIGFEMRSYNRFADMGDGPVKNDIRTRIESYLEILECFDPNYEIRKVGDRYTKISAAGVAFYPREARYEESKG